MKEFFLAMLMFVVCADARESAAPVADDLASAKAAFATFVAYDQTDDNRILDLFSPNCLVTAIMIDGKVRHTKVVPLSAFREAVKEGVVSKEGSKDTYENVKFSRKGKNVMVTATVRQETSDKPGSFFAVYGRDDKRTLRIQELKITINADHTFDDPSWSAVDTKGVRHWGTEYDGSLPWVRDGVMYPRPEYPYVARRRHQEGKGIFRVSIDEQTGRVVKVDVMKSTGFASLDDSVITAALKWHWRSRDWKEVDVPVGFSLGGGPSSHDFGSRSEWRQPTVQSSIGSGVRP